MIASISRRRFNASLLGGFAAAAVGPFVGAARAATPLTLQASWLNDPEFLGYMLAIDKGFYEAVGLKVSYLPGGPNVIPDGSLIAGKSDVALTNIVTTARAIVERGAPLKIIGTQYQKSPLGFLSMAEKGIKGPKDLIGKTLAVSAIASNSIRAFLKMQGIGEDQLRIVPYQFNPTPLINGEVDAVSDFVTQMPFLIEQASKKKVNTFLLYDHGLKFYINLVTVTEETLKKRRADLLAFYRASRKGWAENFADPNKYPAQMHDSWFKGTGSTIEAETYFNNVQIPLMHHPKGLFWMDEEGIQANLDALNKLGIPAKRDMFDTSLLAEL